jgi:hypothetical protein
VVDGCWARGGHHRLLPVSVACGVRAGDRAPFVLSSMHNIKPNGSRIDELVARVVGVRR